MDQERTATLVLANTNKTLLLTILEVINRMVDELPLRQNAHHNLNYIPYWNKIFTLFNLTRGHDTTQFLCY
jgi:hypothetical protein